MGGQPHGAKEIGQPRGFVVALLQREMGHQARRDHLAMQKGRMDPR
jgi:hypothetical protein